MREEFAQGRAAAHRLAALVCLAALLVLGGSGCSRQRLVAGMTAPLIDASMAESFASGDVRTVQEGLPGQLLLLRGMCRSDPGHLGIHTTTVQLYASYAMMFAQDEDEEWAAALYAEGKDVGLRFLKRKEWFAEAWDAGPDRLRAELDERKPRELAPLFMWTAACLGQHVLAHQDQPREMLGLPFVDVLLDAAIALHGDYFYGMPYAVKGIMFATIPQGLGGNLQESDRYFQRAMEIGGRGFLLHRVLYARHRAVAGQDKEKFVNTLNEVLATPPDVIPEIRFINRLAHKQAEALLRRQDELF